VEWAHYMNGGILVIRSKVCKRGKAAGRGAVFLVLLGLRSPKEERGLLEIASLGSSLGM